MPPRRSHTKSRRGCVQCKQRHVKCDEKSPQCGYCTKREIQCSFASLNPVSSANASASASPYSHSGFASPCQTSSTSRNLELRLMHNWSTSTCRTMEQHSDETNLWQTVIPELALSHDFLLDALLALSARHLSHKDPSNTHVWECTALEYQNKAIGGFQRVLESIDSANCEAAFACSVFIMVFSLALPHTQEGSDFSEALSDIIEMRQFLKGVAVVHADYADLIRLGRFGVLFNYHTPPGQTREADGSEMPLPDIYSLVNSALEELQLASLNDTNEELYTHAISSLRQAMHTYCTGSLFAGIAAWPITVKDDYVHLIEQQQPIALSILAHYGIVTHLLRDRWWARDSGKRLVQTILPLLLETKPEWAEPVQRAWTAMAQDLLPETTP